MFGEGAVESSLTGGVDSVGLSVVDLVWGRQAESGVVVVLVIPGEERPAERLGVLDASEAAGEFRLIFECLEVGFRERVVVGGVRPAVRLGCESARARDPGVTGLINVLPR